MYPALNHLVWGMSTEDAWQEQLVPVPRGEGAEAQRMDAKQIETCMCVDPSLPVWFYIMTFEGA